MKKTFWCSRQHRGKKWIHSLTIKFKSLPISYIAKACVTSPRSQCQCMTQHGTGQLVQSQHLPAATFICQWWARCIESNKKCCKNDFWISYRRGQYRPVCFQLYGSDLRRNSGAFCLTQLFLAFTGECLRSTAQDKELDFDTQCWIVKSV